MAADSLDFSALEKKLGSRSASVVGTPTKATPATNAKKSTPAPKVAAVVSKPAPAKVVTPAKVFTPAKVASPVKAASPAKVAAEIKKEAAPVFTKSVPPPSASSGLSTGEALAGVALGLTPFLLVPVIALSAVKGLVSPPKPIATPEPPKTKVPVYTKPLNEGAKEGIEELLSDKVTPDLELTRRGIKLSGIT